MEYAKISKYPKARYLIFYKYCTYPWMIWLSSVAWLNIPLLSCIPEIEQEEEEEEEESIPIVPCLFSFALLLILFALTLETLCTLTWPKIFPHVEHALQCNTPSSHENQDSKKKKKIFSLNVINLELLKGHQETFFFFRVHISYWIKLMQIRFNKKKD